MADDTAGNSTVQDDDVTPTTVDPPRSFSQAEVDRIVQDRLARAKSTPPPDYDDLKAKAERLAQIEAESQSELERAQTRATELETRMQQIEAEARETRLRAAIIAEAAKPGRKVVDPEAVVALLDRSSLELDDSGIPTNIATAMDSLLEAKTFLVAAEATRGSADQGARNGGPNQITEAELKTMRPEAIEQARKEGRLDHLLGVR